MILGARRTDVTVKLFQFLEQGMTKPLLSESGLETTTECADAVRSYINSITKCKQQWVFKHAEAAAL